MITLGHYIALASILFGIGAVGFLTRRSILHLFMSVELMLNSVNLLFVAFSKFRGVADGQVMVLFVFALAASEVAVGLAILIALFKHNKHIDLDKINLMKW